MYGTLIQFAVFIHDKDDPVIIRHLTYITQLQDKNYIYFIYHKIIS